MLPRSLVLLLLTSLADAASSTPAVLQATVKQLIAEPQRFHGKVVEVTGYFSCAFEAGCELRSGVFPEDRLKTILLEFSQKDAVALESVHPLRGWLHVVGRFEYSCPTPERVIRKADPRDPTERGIVQIWQGFSFHACRITVTQFKRI